MTRFISAIVAILASIIGELTGVDSGIVLKIYYDLFNAGNALAIVFYSTVMGFYYVHCFHPKTYETRV